MTYSKLYSSGDCQGPAQDRTQKKNLEAKSERHSSAALFKNGRRTGNCYLVRCAAGVLRCRPAPRGRHRAGGARKRAGARGAGRLTWCAGRQGRAPRVELAGAPAPHVQRSRKGQHCPLAEGVPPPRGLGGLGVVAMGRQWAGWRCHGSAVGRHGRRRRGWSSGAVRCGDAHVVCSRRHRMGGGTDHSAHMVLGLCQVCVHRVRAVCRPFGGSVLAAQLLAGRAARRQHAALYGSACRRAAPWRL